MPDMSDEEREHLKGLAAQAKEEIASERSVGDPPEDFGQMSDEQRAVIEELKRQIEEVEGGESEVGGYKIPTPPSPDSVGEEGEDERPAVKAFIVFQDPDESGRWIANSEIDAILSQIRPVECAVDDLRRGAMEVVEDIRTMLTTQSVMQAQMAIAQQIQSQRETQQVAQNLDLQGMNRAQRRARR